MIISRRLFLIGSGAAIAAASIPTEVVKTPLLVRAPYLRREVSEVYFHPFAKRASAVMISIRRADDTIDLIRGATACGTSFFWSAHPASGNIILGQTETLKIAVDGEYETATVHIVGIDKMPDGTKEYFIENYYFPGKDSERFLTRYVDAEKMPA